MLWLPLPRFESRVLGVAVPGRGRGEWRGNGMAAGAMGAGSGVARHSAQLRLGFNESVVADSRDCCAVPSHSAEWTSAYLFR
jgi:hypothetical protein